MAQRAAEDPRVGAFETGPAGVEDACQRACHEPDQPVGAEGQGAADAYDEAHDHKGRAAEEEQHAADELATRPLRRSFHRP